MLVMFSLKVVTILQTGIRISETSDLDNDSTIIDSPNKNSDTDLSLTDVCVFFTKSVLTI